MSVKKTAHYSKVRSNRIKYLKLFPLFIYDIDRVSEYLTKKRRCSSVFICIGRRR
jgi:hypothetical protein